MTWSLVVLLILLLQYRESEFWRRMHNEAWKLTHDWQSLALDALDRATEFRLALESLAEKSGVKIRYENNASVTIRMKDLERVREIIRNAIPDVKFSDEGESCKRK